MGFYTSKDATDRIEWALKEIGERKADERTALKMDLINAATKAFKRDLITPEIASANYDLANANTSTDKLKKALQNLTFLIENNSY